MAIAEVQNAHTNGTTATEESVSLSGVGVGHLLSLSIFTGNGAEVASVVDNQGNYWIRGCQAQASGSLDNEHWYASGVTAGTTAASVTLSSAPSVDFTLVMIEFSGVSSINAMDQECPNAGTGTAANTGASVQGFTTGTLFISTVTESGATLTAPSGFTSVTTGRTYDGVAYLIDSGQANHNPSWTLNTSELWLTNTISFTTPLVNAPALNSDFNQFPQIQVEWSPTAEPFAPVWRNVARWCQNFKTTQGRQHQLDRIEAGSIDLTFDGRDGTFNPWNTSSVLFNNFQGLQPMNVIRITAAWKGITYYVVYGYVQSITPTLADPVNVDVDVKCWDILQFLSLRYLAGPNYANLVESESSLCAYWRCGDPINGFNNQSSTKVNQILDHTPSTAAGYGPYPAYILNGPGGYPLLGAQNVLLYDSSTALDLTNGTNAPNGGFVGGSPVAGATSWQFECWLQFTGGTDWIPTPTSTSASVNPTIFTTTTTGGELDFKLGWFTYSSGINAVTFYNTFQVYLAGSFVGATVGTDNLDGNWHHLFVAIVKVSTIDIVNVSVDGVNIVNNPNTSLEVSSPELENPVGSVIGCNAGAVNGFAGIIAEVAMYAPGITGTEITAHYNQGLWFQSNEETGANGNNLGSPVGRLNHVLSVAGFGGVYGIGTKFLTAVYGETDPVTTTTALDYTQILMETEPGIIFQGQDGNIYALNRQYVIGHGGSFGIMNSARAATSQGIFGDTAGSTYRFEFKGFDVGQDDLDIWNDIQAQSARPDAANDYGEDTTAGTGNPIQEVNQESDTTGIALVSTNQYGARTLQGLTDLLFLNDSDALAVAQQYLRWYAAGIQRAPNITIQNTANGGVNMPQILGRTIYDRITTQYQGQTAGSQFTQDALIESIEHDVNVATGIWACTFATSPYEIGLVEISAGGVGNPPTGQLTSTNVTPIVLGTWQFGSTGQLVL